MTKENKNIREIRKIILERIEKSVEELFGAKPDSINLVFPPDIALGDFTVECFSPGKQFKKPPAEIAKTISEKLDGEKDEIIEKATAEGPYVNIKVSPSALFGSVCAEIISREESFGNSDFGKNQKVMVEYLSPNTNKPLHLGHLRNGSLGMAIANLFESAGHAVIKANLINDRGVHICKSMLAWQKWGNGSTPQSQGLKGDHFVGKWYVRFAQEAKKDANLEEEVREMLRKWEAGDPEIMKLWKMMNKWVYEGFAGTYKEFGLKFDKFYYESETYKLGKDIIDEGLGKKVFRKDKDGSVVFDLPKEEFGLDKDGNPKKITMLRSDGTSVYMTQELGTALLKIRGHRLDRSVYVVGSEQNYHFRSLFKILESLEYAWAKGLSHLSYGMVYLPEGKMKSREGKVVDADDFIAKIKDLAAEGIRERDTENKISEEEIRERARKIGIGAIKFYLLRVNPDQDINFDPKESISLEGFTGPYCQYAYARISSILKNVESVPEVKITDFSVLDSDEERLIIRKIIQFPDEISMAVKEFNPSRIATHIFELAKAFNQFYHKHPVLGADSEELTKVRLVLIRATSIVLKKGLSLLGIETLERM